MTASNSTQYCVSFVTQKLMCDAHRHENIRKTRMLLAAADASAAVVLAMLMPSLLGARGSGEPIAVDPSYMASNMLTAATRVRLLPSGHAPRTATSLLLPFTAHMRGAPPRLVLAAAVLLFGEPAAAGTISVSVNMSERIIIAGRSSTAVDDTAHGLPLIRDYIAKRGAGLQNPNV